MFSYSSHRQLNKSVHHSVPWPQMPVVASTNERKIDNAISCCSD